MHKSRVHYQALPSYETKSVSFLIERKGGLLTLNKFGQNVRKKV